MSELNQPATTKRKKAQPLPLNTLGKLLSKVRIDTELSTTEFADKAGVSLATLNKYERTDTPMPLEFVRAVYPIVPTQYIPEFCDIVAKQLGILLIPSDATVEQINAAWITLNVVTQPVTVSNTVSDVNKNALANSD